MSDEKQSSALEEKRARARALIQQRAAKPRALPPSFAQQRLWFLDRLEPGSHHYGIPFAVRLSGTLERSALEKSFQEIVQRHESLRTTFQAREGEAVQVVGPAPELPLHVVDLGGLDAQETARRVRELTAEDVAAPFDLERGPLIRWKLLRLSDAEHILLLSMHHIVSDGWSIGVFVRELAALYAAFLQGAPSPLPPLTVQYSDFARWQRDWLQGDVLEEQLAYWRAHLADAPTALGLPTDRPRPPAQTFRGTQLPLGVSSAVTAALNVLSRQEGATLFMTLLAAWLVLLQRYTRQDDLVVGTPIANRNRAETEGLIGFFVNTLPLRTNLSGDPRFTDLMGRVRETALGGFAHQDVPFEKLVMDLRVKRDLSRSPLFQTMFVLQNAPLQPLALPGLTLTNLDLETDTAKFELTLTLVETSGALTGWLEYNTDLFDASTAHRLARAYERLLEGIAADPERRVSALPLLDAAGRQQALESFHPPAVPLSPRALHVLFEEQARRTPEAIAVECEDDLLTYAELERRANRLAHLLLASGLEPEERVALCLPRSTEVLVAMLAVMKAGGAFVPMDAGAPTQRLALMVAECRARYVLAPASLAVKLPVPPEARLEPGAWRQEGLLETPPARTVHLEQLAYVVHTSGSTGVPKGVMISHAGIANRMLWEQHALPIGPEDRVLQVASFGFDASIWEFFRALLAGARAVMVRDGAHQDSRYIADLMARRGVTQMNVVPSLLRVVLEEPRMADCRALRTVVCGGEALTTDLVDRLAEHSSATLFNFYGQTEVSIDATWFTCAPGMARKAVPLGQPLGNMKMHVLDMRGQPVPPGAPGEVYLGGPGLARGYFLRPDLSAERFVPDPFGPPGSRLFRTGDLARQLPDGELEFLGRGDHQVKIRGVRVELGEIEAALRQHPAIQDVVVLAREQAVEPEPPALDPRLLPLEPPPRGPSPHPLP
ncbi:amino acid adenylation domain-containing protein [Corallococcus sp. AB032C]|uniref:non-ribosomal peptide synthetase n=1 Tax=Corallococcus TaxID=83461 RepID=UPI000EBE0464|nr:MULTISPECIES: amino acid adenylation domain-containing protein [Corallococcus]NPC46131.1 amino acid adenylation domain-containing protein [Corallococcus exiguus]RKH81689.1 amino acid adenylation domain-containing protein [Corallococcus sp. AB032C]